MPSQMMSESQLWAIRAVILFLFCVLKIVLLSASISLRKAQLKCLQTSKP